ncbi:mitochondrial coenzyme A diphosphatase NUDT8 isoform X2 [Anolis sagrei]|uniref:mitochondrial coenzyme A diphosphatase NUDT8 isoform X2 n=1 Tax=Anolis sagrei TaxID=38937 RepID=UPI00352033B7
MSSAAEGCWRRPRTGTSKRMSQPLSWSPCAPWLGNPPSCTPCAPAPCLVCTKESFPGGKCDDSDRDIVATALRETREELGLHLGEDCVWGIMRPLPDRTKIMVVPVLANLGPLEQLILKPNPQEVEAVFTLSISHLLKEQNQGYTHFCKNGVYSYTMPVFPRGPHRVWGLTAIITELTLELLAPGKYQRRTRVVGRH